MQRRECTLCVWMRGKRERLTEREEERRGREVHSPEFSVELKRTVVE